MLGVMQMFPLQAKCNRPPRKANVFTIESVQLFYWKLCTGLLEFRVELDQVKETAPEMHF